MINFVTAFALTFICGSAVIWLQARRRRLLVFENSNIPLVSRPNIIFGNLADIGSENVKFISRGFAEHGETFGYFVGTRPHFCTKDLNLLKRILISDHQTFINRPKMLTEVFCIYPQLRLALMFARNREWSLSRSTLRLSFSTKRLEAMSSLVSECIDSLFTRLKKVENTEIDVSVPLKETILDVISRTAFGFVVNPTKKGHREILAAFNGVLKADLSGMEVLLILFPELYVPLNWTRRMFHWVASKFYRAPESVLYDLCHQLIEMRRAGAEKFNDLLEAMLLAEVDLTESLNNPRKDDGGELKERCKKMSEAEIAANAVAFLIAGYETTSTSLAFVAHHLVNYPEVQARVRDEARSLLAKDGEIAFNVFHQLPYLEAVIDETLRLYPAATFIASRESSTNYATEEITIPQDSFIIVPIYQLHHDPLLWDEPEKFDPDRFFGENKTKINRMAYMPFGTGPRNCIGLRFAVLVMKLFLAKLLLKYELVPTDQTEIGQCSVVYKHVVMAPKNGLFMKLVLTDR